MSAPLDYAQPQRTHRLSNPRKVFAILIGLCTVVLGVAVLLPSMNRPRNGGSNSIRCASNLKQIGLAMLLYANENKGHFPPGFEELLLTQDITAEVFVCPSTTDEKAEGPTTQATADQLTAGGHLSYTYRGAGLTDAAPAEAILAYEKADQLQHPERQGHNVLFGDGHVELIAEPVFRKLLAELDAGHNPPR